ncbi:Neurotrypsin [Mytilus coruscus]|uniref:Neurotrypsin n=1 Tax=Mytilus coruscus TaxID=42192 RepID=A0A6J8D5J4_MYTCO|nr:Neurotrypsin [Mytilus coruscus]
MPWKCPIITTTRRTCVLPTEKVAPHSFSVEYVSQSYERIALAASAVNDGEGSVWLDDVNCSGQESELLNCTYNTDTSDCNHNEDVGVHCFLSCSTENDGDLRIISGIAANIGRLEVNYKGEWGTVCDDRFGNVDAAVACRQLGYCSGVVVSASVVNDGIGSIWLDEVGCTGSESKLFNCTHSKTPDCKHTEDIGVNCLLSCSAENEGVLRIIWEAQENKGRLEIYHKGEWGTVCDDGFKDVDAAVACRQLGYCSGVLVAASAVHNGVDTIWLDDVNCNGSESKLLDCPSNDGKHNCNHGEDIGIHCFLSCSTENNSDINLFGGKHENEGRLEIFLNNAWGTVCDDYFEDIDAEVVCRQLGLWGGIVIPASAVDNGYDSIWLDDVQCKGTENRLTNCSYRDSPRCNHGEDIGVKCFINPPTEDQGKLRLVGGSSGNNGRLEIKLYNEWGTVCDDSFANVEAAVACRQLGYCSGNALQPNMVNDGTGTILLAGLLCSGIESRLVNCLLFDSVIQSCRSYHDVGVSCSLTCPTAGKFLHECLW